MNLADHCGVETRHRCCEPPEAKQPCIHICDCLRRPLLIFLAAQHLKSYVLFATAAPKSGAGRYSFYSMNSREHKNFKT